MTDLPKSDFLNEASLCGASVNLQLNFHGSLHSLSQSDDVTSVLLTISLVTHQVGTCIGQRSCPKATLRIDSGVARAAERGILALDVYYQMAF